MNLLKKVFYPNIIPKLKNQIECYNINKTVKKAFTSETGVLSIHFWAPTFKWSISIANIADINRHPNLLSFPQQFAIFLTGLLFTKFSLYVKPKNYNLLAINMFMSLTALYQLARISHYKYNVYNNAKQD